MMKQIENNPKPMSDLEIANKLSEIREKPSLDYYASIELIMRRKGYNPDATSCKAFLVKAIINRFGKDKNSDALLMAFGLLNGYQNIRSIGERRDSYMKKTNFTTSPDNHRKKVEDPLIATLASFIEEIADLNQFMEDALDYIAPDENGICKNLQPSYLMSQENAVLPAQPKISPEECLKKNSSRVIGIISPELAEQEEFTQLKYVTINDKARELLDAGRMSWTEYYYLENYLEVAKRADEILSEEGTQKTVRDDFDFDWFFRFFEAVGKISNEDMQELWARVLAGEIKNQGSFSLRTIETLQNMTVKEAMIFHQLASIALQDQPGARHMLLYENIEDSYLLNYHYNITEDDIRLMQEIGVITATHKDAILMMPTPMYSLFLGDKCLLLWLLNSKASFRFSFHWFTDTGEQLFKIISKEITPNPDYLVDLGRILRWECKDMIDVVVSFTENLTKIDHGITEEIRATDLMPKVEDEKYREFFEPKRRKIVWLEWMPE